uniref:Uncharacterized protein n=1 Tax=Buteo japonicus TaxID=224669 RepID=A0A8C0BQ97_9AVES
MNRDQFGGGRKNKGATCILKCLLVCTWGSCHREAPAELLSHVERAFCCASDQCLASASLLLALCWFAKPTEKTSVSPHEDMKVAFMAEMKAENIKQFL